MTQTATTEAPPEAEDIGDKAPDPRLLPLQEEYDRLLGVRADLERPASRAEKLDGIAEAVRAGEPVPDLWLNIDARALQVDGVTRAIEQVGADIVEVVGQGREHRLKTAVPVTTGGQAFTSAVEGAYDAAEARVAVSDARLKAITAYNRALEKNQRGIGTVDGGGGGDMGFYASDLTDDEREILKAGRPA